MLVMTFHPRRFQGKTLHCLLGRSRGGGRVGLDAMVKYPSTCKESNPVLPTVTSHYTEYTISTYTVDYDDIILLLGNVLLSRNIRFSGLFDEPIILRKSGYRDSDLA